MAQEYVLARSLVYSFGRQLCKSELDRYVYKIPLAGWDGIRCLKEDLWDWFCREDWIVLDMFER